MPMLMAPRPNPGAAPWVRIWAYPDLLASAARTPPTRRMSSTSPAESEPPAKAPPGPRSSNRGAAETSTAIPRLTVLNRSSNDLDIVSVSTKVPATNATPNAMARAVMARRTRWATSALSVARHIQPASSRLLAGCSAAKGLHPVEDGLGRRARELVGHGSVGQEDH